MLAPPSTRRETAFVYVTFQTCGSSNKGSVLTGGCKQRATYIKSLRHGGCFVFFWMTNGVRPSHVFVCLGESMGNAALGQGSKQSERGDVDTPYLMDRPLRKHSLEQAAEKCLTHIGGMLLAGDVCKQQPSPSAVVGVQCEGPRRSVQDGCCAKNKLALP